MSALRLNSVLTKLTVRNVNAEGIAKLATVFSELPTLKSLELRGHIGSDVAKQLGKYSNHCKCTVVTVDIRKVTDSALCFFAAVLYSYTTMCIKQQILPSVISLGFGNLFHMTILNQ